MATNNKPIVAQIVMPRDYIVESIIAKFQKRSVFGLSKYGTTLDRTDLSTLDWINHAQEELMDGILYLEKLKQSFPDTSIPNSAVTTCSSTNVTAMGAKAAADTEATASSYSYFSSG